MLKRGLSLVVWMTVASATFVGAGTVDRELYETYEVSRGTTLRLLHGDGDVDIRPWAQDRLEVTVRYHLESRGLGGTRDFEADFVRSGDTITVEGREIGSSFFFGGARRYEYRYTIQAPPYLLLELRGDDGDVEIADWEAAIDLRNEDGDVRIEGLSGNLSLQVDDGDLELFDCAVGIANLRLEDGDVTLRRGSGEWTFVLDDGDLDLRDLAATRLDVRSEDGDIDVDLAPAASFEGSLRTDDGDISLGLHPGFSARFSIEVDDGSIALRAEDVTVESEGEHRTTGRVGGGAGSLEISTSDGDVTLRPSG